MPFSTSSVESLTRPQLAVALISAAAVISAGYYTYQNLSPGRLDEQEPDGAALHRSNAIRRPSRHADAPSNSSSEEAGDENAEAGPMPSHLMPPETEQLGTDNEEWWNQPNQPAQRAGHNVVNLLFRVSEDNARRNGSVHRGCQCNSCGMVPIRGFRYRCINCADFDLCETCESQGVHIKTHIFYKIRVPVPPFGHRQMQPVWYPGNPETCRHAVPKGIMARLSRETGFERPELEAFWEQWTFMANTEWKDDPDQFCIAMDRKTFERCLVPTGASSYARPNLIHDRMFAFYDQNNDGIISFTEFLHGLSYRKRDNKLQTVFSGYDIDGDGYVSRRDFLRMFKAYYVLYKQMHRDIIDGLENQRFVTTEARQLVYGRQPLSSYFGREERVPPADASMRFDGKTYHRDGHVDIDDEEKGAFVQSETDTATRNDILTGLFACETERRAHREAGSSPDDENHAMYLYRRRLSNVQRRSNYWLSILDPPTNLQELSDIFISQGDGAAEDSAQNEDDGNDGNDDNEPRLEAGPPTESGRLARELESWRRKIPKKEKKKRDMARHKLQDRWNRRQFYLDEEEGGTAPDDWSDTDDVFTQAEEAEERVRRRANAHTLDMYGLDFPGRPPRPKQDVPTYRQGEAEDDAGKEILYQVTQQAFNELLDVIFKPAENIALQAAETKVERMAFADLINEVDPLDLGSSDCDEKEDDRDTPAKTKLFPGQTPSEALDDCRRLSEVHPRLSEADASAAEGSAYRDPTMPQYRPDSVAVSDASRQASTADTTKKSGRAKQPSKRTLRMLKRLTLAERQAEARGGWGKLNFEEFEKIYNVQESLGNQLGYLGSWIDFCIP